MKIKKKNHTKSVNLSHECKVYIITSKLYYKKTAKQLVISSVTRLISQKNALAVLLKLEHLQFMMGDAYL